MNWTGGALPRSRGGNAKANLTNKQKKHFAKVRGKLLNGPRSSPDLDFSVFDHAKGPGGLPKKRAHSSSEKSYRYGSQTRLEDCRQVAPLVRQLSSIKPRHISPGSPSLRYEKARDHCGSDTVPQSTSVSHSRSAEPNHQPHIRRQDGVARKPHMEVSKPVIEDIFESRRHDLLRRQDWVGLANTRPARIHFTDARDRHLIGKRRQLENTERDHCPRKRLRRNLVQHHLRAPSSVGDISVRIGQPNRGRADQVTPPHGKGSLTGMVEEMLFGDDHASVHSLQNTGTGSSRPHQDPNKYPPMSTTDVQVEGLEKSGSVQTSWAGFSPWSNSVHWVAHGERASGINETGGLKTFSAQRGSQDGPNAHSSVLDLADTGQFLERNAWVDVPGLPLVFEDHPEKPIEISSNSSSEGYSATHSSSRNSPEQSGVSRDRCSELQGCDHDQEGEFGAVVLSSNDGSNPLESRVIGSRPRESQPRGSDTKPQPRPTKFAWTDAAASNNIAQAPELPEEAPQQPVSVAINRPLSSQETTKGVSLIDEELIWRKFVFDDDSVDGNEPEKPSKHTGSISGESLLLTGLSTSPERSSLSAQASSAPLAALIHQLESTNSTYDPPPTETGSSLPLTQSDISFPSRESEGSLSASEESRHNSSISLLTAHASTSSPARPHQVATSPSSDELVVTPRHPTFYFKKPSRYVGSQVEVPATVHLGRSSRGKRRKRSDTAVSKKEKAKPDKAAEQESSEDEIFDS